MADPADLCTIEDVAAARRHDTGALDELTASLITAASLAAMAWTGRRIRPLDEAPVARLIDPLEIQPGEYMIDDLSDTPTAVQIIGADGATAATLDVASSVLCLPLNRAAGEPIRRLRLRPSTPAPSRGQLLQVTGRWGWPQIPADVRQAVVETVCEWLKQRQALTTQSPDQFEPGTPPARALPLIARNLLGPYRRMGVA